MKNLCDACGLWVAPRENLAHFPPIGVEKQSGVFMNQCLSQVLFSQVPSTAEYKGGLVELELECQVI